MQLFPPVKSTVGHIDLQLAMKYVRKCVNNTDNWTTVISEKYSLSICPSKRPGLCSTMTHDTICVSSMNFTVTKISIIKIYSSLKYGWLGFFFPSSYKSEKKGRLERKTKYPLSVIVSSENNNQEARPDKRHSIFNNITQKHICPPSFFFFFNFFPETLKPPPLQRHNKIFRIKREDTSDNGGAI